MLKKLSLYIDHSEKNNLAESSKKEGRFSGESFDFLSLIKSWKDIAGAKLAEHTIPLKNHHGVLVILSNHSAFANELSYMELPLKKKIFSKFPDLEKSIKSIKFIVDSSHFDNQYAQFVTPALEKKKFELHPRSPEFKKLSLEASELFKDLEDDEVKAKMVSIYIQTMAKS